MRRAISKTRRRGHCRFAVAAFLVSVCGCNETLYTTSPGLPAYSTSPYAPAPANTLPPSHPVAPQAVTVAPQAAIAPPAPGGGDKQLFRNESAKSGRGELDLKIDRLWAENGFTYATVSIRNTSPHELDEITIQCTAFGAGHVNLNFREQALLTRRDGSMPPGFAKTLKIRLERGGFNVREMTCSARGW